MATQAKTFFDSKDTGTSTAIITVASSIGVFYSIATRKSMLQTIGYTLLFALGGVVVSVVTANIITTNE